jgi:hypothetical protein
VDPREDGEIAAAIERVLFDRSTRDGLTAQLSHFSAGDWSSYASDLWTAFTGGLDDTGPPGSAHSMENDVRHG